MDRLYIADMLYYVLLVARLLAAYFSPIPDCDEVFNFWEPTHFITHGSGLQTWEWSPVYAIRSWCYVGLHAAVVRLLQVAHLKGPQLFFGLRIVLASIEAWTEYRLARVLLKKYGEQVCWIFVVLTVSAAGLFHASVAYLPSSFAMYCMTLAFALFLDSPRRNIVKVMVCIALGGLLGWPFVLVLALPLGAYYTVCSGSPKEWARSVGKSVGLALLVLAAIVVVDSFMFKKLAVVPFNIVGYNVFFASEDSGPDIFGTEPWTYYVSNLVLNFNLVFPLALISAFFVDFQTLAGLGTMYLWLGIFVSTPHKEERFLYVVYPIICTAAAFTLSRTWQAITSVLRLPNGLLYAAVISIAALGVSRSAALAHYYNAPFAVYQGVPANSTVCVGREWYRYPSGYFMDGQLKFVASGFDGLLPGEFESYTTVPKGMNNQNKADPGKLVSIDECDFFVDIDLPVDVEAGELDPETNGWTKDVCRPFLDASSSTGIARLLYFGLDRTPLGTSKYVDYCRYKRA